MFPADLTMNNSLSHACNYFIALDIAIECLVSKCYSLKVPLIKAGLPDGHCVNYANNCYVQRCAARCCCRVMLQAEGFVNDI